MYVLQGQKCLRRTEITVCHTIRLVTSVTIEKERKEWRAERAKKSGNRDSLELNELTI